MEFNEKLQELRKQRGLTQDELAKELYVSRTAISKWESGRGYPSIDSLKEISRYFSVSIDSLLSSEELITAARDENDSNMRSIYRLLSGIADVMSIMFILLPLYPCEKNGHITSVTLWHCTHQKPILLVYWILFILLVSSGSAGIILNRLKAEKGQRILTAISFVLSMAAVLYLIMTRVPYAAVTEFFLLALKAVSLYKMPREKNQ
ncbi:helix-turn-helix domain-containing protein [Ruminococcus albus]|uniref:DNA-binding transcriptional regulator, XRE-family HTH domain n=1 Tax=Ruminococcus albus TaxID=1264 RepID=A0A1I1CVP9_RUMAL|nr:helix-turn-helix transcriptional regulator [Ruminococcus albus]SFB66711.1 DNA-binding transcriptional regulator, XRE-family HTH domain [Ruminococcus albus]